MNSAFHPISEYAFPQTHGPNGSQEDPDEAEEKFEEKNDQRGHRETWRPNAWEDHGTMWGPHSKVGEYNSNNYGL